MSGINMAGFENVTGFELKIEGSGECRDAQGRLLDSEGNPVEDKESD